MKGIFRLASLVLTLTMLLAPFSTSVGAVPAPEPAPVTLKELAPAVLPMWAEPPVQDNNGDWPTASAAQQLAQDRDSTVTLGWRSGGLPVLPGTVQLPSANNQDEPPPEIELMLLDCWRMHRRT